VTLAPKVTNEQLIAERHAQLVAAATELFLEKGFHKTTVREIAAAAGWNMGTLYLYINQKEDVLHLISQAIMRELSDGLTQVPAGPTAKETLRAAADYFFRAVDRMRREIKLLYRESASLRPEHLEALKASELQERAFFASVIRRGVEQGEFRPVAPDFLAHDLIMLAHMWALKGWALRSSVSFEEYAEHQINLLFTQLLPLPAAEQA
jgi:AcrR family transcriptional regulator